MRPDAVVTNRATTSVDIQGIRTPIAGADLERLTADDLCWTPQSATWPSSRPVLATAIEMLPTLEDDLMADLLEALALALVDREDELRAVRAVLSQALALSHTQHLEIVRLRKRLADLLDARRQERPAA